MLKPSSVLEVVEHAHYVEQHLDKIVPRVLPTCISMIARKTSLETSWICVSWGQTCWATNKGRGTKEGTISKQPHNILFIVYHTSLFRDVGDFITKLTILGYKLVTTTEKEKHQWEEYVSTIIYL